jgi:iron complex transport system substrate-binding protein
VNKQEENLNAELNAKGRAGEFSRRDFLKTLGLLAGSSLFASGAVFSASGCSGEEAMNKLTDVSGLEQEKRTVTDDAGREVEIPAKADVEKVFATSALAQFFLFTLDWEKLGAVTSSFSKEDQQYLPSEIADLPRLGSWTSNTLSAESLMLEDIQIVFSISAVELTKQNIDDAEKLQDQSGVPVILIDGSMDKTVHAYEFLGECIGSDDRAKELADYCNKVYEDVTAAVGSIPDAQKRQFYYAEGTSGLTSKAEGNQHVVAFELAGGKNVVQVETAAEAMDSVTVSREQLLQWNPETIFAQSFDDGGADEVIRESDDWSSITAVKKGQVYTLPSIPFTWVDKPSAANRFLGVQWLANLFYPDKYKIDIVKTVKEYYSLFYSVEITDEEAKGFLGNSYKA